MPSTYLARIHIPPYHHRVQCFSLEVSSDGSSYKLLFSNNDSHRLSAEEVADNVVEQLRAEGIASTKEKIEEAKPDKPQYSVTVNSVQPLALAKALDLDRYTVEKLEAFDRNRVSGTWTTYAAATTSPAKGHRSI